MFFTYQLRLGVLILNEFPGIAKYNLSSWGEVL